MVPLEISADAIEGTLEHFNTIGPSDIYPLSPEFELLLASPQESARLIFRQLKHFDGTREQEYAPPLIGHVEIGKGQYRKSLYLDPLLDVLLTSLVKEIASEIERMRLPCNSNTVWWKATKAFNKALLNLVTDKSKWEQNLDRKKLIESVKNGKTGKVC